MRNECEYARNNGRCMKSPIPVPPAASPRPAPHVPDIEDARGAASRPPAAAGAAKPAVSVPQLAGVQVRLPAQQSAEAELTRLVMAGQQLQQLRDAHAAAEPVTHASPPDRHA